MILMTSMKHSITKRMYYSVLEDDKYAETKKLRTCTLEAERPIIDPIKFGEAQDTCTKLL